VGEDSLLERVVTAAEERHLSQNTLTAYRRTWLKLIAWSAAVRSGLKIQIQDISSENEQGAAVRGRDWHYLKFRGAILRQARMLAQLR
jgi:hypothetical protein